MPHLHPLRMKINKHCFPNGLRLVHHEDTSTQMVALNIVYDVGARDEHPEHTGFAHLFEHLMFGGSAHIPDYDTPLQLAGGENNACLFSYAVDEDAAKVHHSITVTFVIFTSSSGRSLRSVFTCCILSTTSMPSSTSPNTVYSPSKCGVPPTVV